MVFTRRQLAKEGTKTRGTRKRMEDVGTKDNVLVKELVDKLRGALRVRKATTKKSQPDKEESKSLYAKDRELTPEGVNSDSDGSNRDETQTSSLKDVSEIQNQSRETTNPNNTVSRPPRLTPIQEKIISSIKRHSCCNCTRYTKYKTKRCPCFKKGMPCDQKCTARCENDQEDFYVLDLSQRVGGETTEGRLNILTEIEAEAAFSFGSNQEGPNREEVTTKERGERGDDEVSGAGLVVGSPEDSVTEGTQPTMISETTDTGISETRDHDEAPPLQDPQPSEGEMPRTEETEEPGQQEREEGDIAVEVMDLPPPLDSEPNPPAIERIHYEGDHEGVFPNPADFKLRRVYGDHIHQNDGSHLSGGVVDDGVWQNRWKTLINLPSRRYVSPQRRIGRRFVEMLVKELDGMLRRKWNSERVL